MMELYIFDASLNFVGLLDNFISLQWTRRYAKYGEFELHCSLNPENLALLVRGNIVWKLSLIHISEPTRLGMISYAVFCLKKKKKNIQKQSYTIQFT